VNKENIFKKIDELYTKSVKTIIGDISTDEEQTTFAKKVQAKALPKITTLKDTFSSMKSKILSMGTVDEKALLYKEVVKREKQEAKEAKKLAKAKNNSTKTSTKKATAAKTKTTTKTTTKKTSPKKSVSKTTTKKKEASTGTKNTAVTKKTTTSKTTKVAAKKTATKKTMSKSKSTKKEKSTLSKKDIKIALYAKDITKHYGEVDNDLLTLIVKNLGPSIYQKNAELVSCSEPKELDTVRRNFLIKKLGIDASKAVLDAAIQDVCAELKGVDDKYRATFYYSLTKKFKKESTLS